jgi:hypothetical protein
MSAPCDSADATPAAGVTLYDLLPDQEVELKDGRVVTLTALQETAGEKWVAVHGRIFRPNSDSYSVKAKVTGPGDLSLWDAKTRISHRWAHLALQPETMAPLLEAAAVAMSNGDDPAWLTIDALVTVEINGVVQEPNPARVTKLSHLNGRIWGACIEGSETGIELKDLRPFVPPPVSGLARAAAAPPPAAVEIEITVFTKSGGPLTKSIEIGADGKPVSDGSACKMSRGRAWRARIGSLDELAKLIECQASNQAIALGPLRDGIPDDVEIVTKRKVVPGGAAIARTAANLIYRPGKSAFVLFDYDTKGMPGPVAQTLAAAGGFWPALVSVLPALKSIGYLVRLSTSAGLSRTDTGETFPGSGGLHVYPTIADGADAVRFLKTLHARCWLVGLGWFNVGAAGQLLERSIIDRMVGAPERLVFEGPPTLVSPLVQDAAARRPTVVAGGVLDTVAGCPPLTVLEQDAFDRLRAQAKLRLAPECAAKRAAWIAAREAKLAARTGMTEAEAKATLEKQIDGLLLAGVELEFDDDELNGTTVADVLDDPERFEGETLADPVEGVAYGYGKAVVMIGDDGLPFIHSFAHGRSIYQLRYDVAAVRARLARATDMVAELVRLVGMAELTAVELLALVHETAESADTGVRAIQATLKAAAEERNARTRSRARERATAERTDPRPLLMRPEEDAEVLPVVEAINAVADASERVRRDVEGTITHARRMVIMRTHAFEDANEPEEDDDQPASS